MSEQWKDIRFWPHELHVAAQMGGLKPAALVELGEAMTSLLADADKLLAENATLQQRVKALEQGLRHIRAWADQNQGILSGNTVGHAVARMCDDALAAAQDKER